MSILSEQNILAEPTLVDAARRPGGVVGSAALYSFAHDYQAAESTSVTLGGFTKPSTYAINEEVLEVAKLPLPTVTGVNGESILQGTQYGNPGFATASDAQQTNLGAVAEVLGGNEEAVTPTMATDTLANESSFNKETGADTAPVASGGAVAGFTEENKYEVNKNAGQSEMQPRPQQNPTDDLTAEAVTLQPRGGGGATQTQPRPSGPPEVSAPVAVVSMMEEYMTGSQPGQTNQGSNAYPPTALDNASPKGTKAKKGLDYY